MTDPQIKQEGGSLGGTPGLDDLHTPQPGQASTGDEPESEAARTARRRKMFEIAIQIHSNLDLLAAGEPARDTGKIPVSNLGLFEVLKLEVAVGHSFLKHTKAKKAWLGRHKEINKHCDLKVQMKWNGKKSSQQMPPQFDMIRLRDELIDHLNQFGEEAPPKVPFRYDDGAKPIPLPSEVKAKLPPPRVGRKRVPKPEAEKAKMLGKLEAFAELAETNPGLLMVACQSMSREINVDKDGCRIMFTNDGICFTKLKRESATDESATNKKQKTHHEVQDQGEVVVKDESDEGDGHTA